MLTNSGKFQKAPKSFLGIPDLTDFLSLLAHELTVPFWEGNGALETTMQDARLFAAPWTSLSAEVPRRGGSGVVSAVGVIGL